MDVSNRGINALCKLRADLQEDAGDDFPDDVLRELLVINDIANSLGLNVFQRQEVLGDKGYAFVQEFLNTRIRA